MSDLYDIPIHTLQGAPSSLAPYKEALLQVRADLRGLQTRLDKKDDPLRAKIQKDVVDTLADLAELCVKVGRVNEKEVRSVFLSERFPTLLPRLAALLP